MPTVRCVALLIAAVMLLVQPVATWASAGIDADVSCCCPDPHKCKCHDHDTGPTSPTMRRCDAGHVKVVVPVLLVAVVPAATPTVDVPRPVSVPFVEPTRSLEDRTVPPEKPPF